MSIRTLNQTEQNQIVFSLTNCVTALKLIEGKSVFTVLNQQYSKQYWVKIVCTISSIAPFIFGFYAYRQHSTYIASASIGVALLGLIFSYQISLNPLPQTGIVILKMATANLQEAWKVKSFVLSRCFNNRDKQSIKGLTSPLQNQPLSLPQAQEILKSLSNSYDGIPSPYAPTLSSEEWSWSKIQPDILKSSRIIEDYLSNQLKDRNQKIHSKELNIVLDQLQNTASCFQNGRPGATPSDAYVQLTTKKDGSIQAAPWSFKI